MHQGSLTFSNLRNDFLLSKEFPISSENAGIADSFPETRPYEPFDPSYSSTNAQTMLQSKISTFFSIGSMIWLLRAFL
jgi:hypothetical protein